MLNTAKVSNNDFIKKHRSQKERVGISVNWTVLVTYKNKTVELEVRMINCKLIIWQLIFVYVAQQYGIIGRHDNEGRISLSGIIFTFP